MSNMNNIKLTDIVNDVRSSRLTKIYVILFHSELIRSYQHTQFAIFIYITLGYISFGLITL